MSSTASPVKRYVGRRVQLVDGGAVVEEVLEKGKVASFACFVDRVVYPLGVFADILLSGKRGLEGPEQLVVPSELVRNTFPRPRPQLGARPVNCMLTFAGTKPRLSPIAHVHQSSFSFDKTLEMSSPGFSKRLLHLRVRGQVGPSPNPKRCSRDDISSFERKHSLIATAVIVKQGSHGHNRGATHGPPRWCRPGCRRAHSFPGMYIK